MSFGEKLAKLRKEKGMNQEELAQELNVSRQAVSKWESNNSYPETDKIVAICKLFNSSMDELIGLKEGKHKKENNFFNKINEYFEMFIKGIKMFYSMTFIQKIKCLIEMGFYALVIIAFLAIINAVLYEICYHILYILPSELISVLLETFQGILIAIYCVIVIYLLIRLYKLRYLDYYEEPKKEVEIEINDKENKIHLNNKENINVKSEKIIIRDSNESLNPFNWLKRICLLFVKIITLFISFGLSIAFVILIAVTIFVIYFLNKGILLLWVILGLLGVLLFTYLVLEVLIKFIFNLKQKPKKIFIIFIVSLILCGVGSGLFASEISTYKIITYNDFNKLAKSNTYKMDDSLVLTYLVDSNVEIIIEDRNDINVEFYTSEKDNIDISFYGDTESYYEKNNKILFRPYEYYSVRSFNGNSFDDFVSAVMNAIENKEIYINDSYYNVLVKIHISEKNYLKLSENLRNYRRFY